MLRPQRHVAAVEIAHLAGAHIHCADGEPCGLAVQMIEIHQFRECAPERIGRIEGRPFDADRHLETPRRMRVDLEETGHTLRNRAEIGEGAAEESRRP